MATAVCPNQIIQATGGNFPITAPGDRVARITSDFPVDIYVSGTMVRQIRLPGQVATHYLKSTQALSLRLPTGLGAGGRSEIATFNNPEGTIGGNTERHGLCWVDMDGNDYKLDYVNMPSHHYLLTKPWGIAEVQPVVLVQVTPATTYQIGGVTPAEFYLESVHVFRRNDAANFQPRGGVNEIVFILSDTFTGVVRERFFALSRGGAIGAGSEGAGVTEHFGGLKLPFKSMFTAIGDGSQANINWLFEGTDETVATTLVIGMSGRYRLSD